jgi:O-acetyl-ADP-ribose deacetylase (regulator of RNase III)
MGKGIALGFKERFPDMFEDYVNKCERREVKLGKPYLYKRPIFPWIINFPTKDHWRSVSRLEDIIKGLEFIVERYEEWGIKSIAFPPLGSGLGQLNWDIVGPTLYKYLKKMNIPV